MPNDWTLRQLHSDDLLRLSPETLFSLQDKVAVVTGAGGGLGAWLSAGLAAAGARVLLTDHPRSSTAEAAAAIRSTGALVEEQQCDLTDDAAAQRIVDAALARFGRLDIVVNNAGTNRR